MLNSKYDKEYDPEIVQLYYDEDSNYMFDCDGVVVHDIFRYVTPSQLLYFKDSKEWMMVKGVNGMLVELVYPSGPYGSYPY